ncbi:hypothetical protein FACS1894188_00980 [Clostridia bacterium]|nr:hypothetical protein FACS1894188_00980 [Clostridia bacterium]
MKKKRKKRVKVRIKGLNGIIAFFIVLLGITAVVAVILYAKSESEKKPNIFVSQRKNLAEKYYNDVMDYDFDGGMYPKTPEEVVAYSIKANMLKYGDMLVDDSLIKDILVQERHLYAPSMLDELPLDEQYDKLIQGLAAYKEKGTICFSMVQESTNTYNDRVVIRVVWNTNNMGKLVWRYILNNDNKIIEYSYID